MSLVKRVFSNRLAVPITVALSAVTLMSIFAADSPTPARTASPDTITKSQPEAKQPERKSEQASTKSDDKNITLGAVGATTAPQPTPSQNVTINLIHRLVQRGVLPQQDADELIKQAEDDAAQARAIAVQTRTQGARIEEDPSLAPIEPPPLASTLAVQPTPAPLAENGSEREMLDDEDAVRVSYVPDVVK